MDEKKQIKPSSRQPLLLRLLNLLTAVMFSITLLTSIFILLDAALPHLGITLNFNTHGNSMDPTIRGNAFVVISLPSRTPYESLEVGDVILFKEPKGLNTATDRIRVNISKVPIDGSTDADSTDSGSPGETSESAKSAESESIYSLENIEYLPDRAVLHRIVDIKDTEDAQTLLITKGNANPYLDRYPVTEDAYMGRMLWHVDYVGSVLLFLYQNFTVITALTVVMASCTALLRHSVRSIRTKSR